MQLDFQTLYIIILLNSLGLIVVWTSVAFVYREIAAARYWLAALVGTSIGGLLLTVDANGAVGVATVAGMVFIGCGFATILQGVAVFYDGRARWRLLAAYAVVCAVLAEMAGPDRAVQNVVFALLQALPTSLLLLMLATRRPVRLGATVATFAAGIALSGQILEIAANLARIAGSLSDAGYYAFAPWLLVANILGTSVLNLGFLLMTIDRLSSALADLASRDDLTDLPNRRGLRNRARRVERRGREQGECVSVMMLDVDSFKQINDTFGHHAGDACLVHIAGILSNGLHRKDILARVSGDEFCAILPATDMRDAAQIADMLVKQISTTPFLAGKSRIPLSVSIGIAEWSPVGSEGLFEALTRADAALYDAKRSGRNGYATDLPEGEDRRRALG
ncbi:diguanylate cyclase [Nitratireductor aquimarinus]|uniref:GGDEF domain-containing protein n=1 Tax=Nitratireductor aquimarinus TaxID=889300 RepID=UPI003B5C14FF